MMKNQIYLRKHIYIKTEPGGRVVFGKLNDDQILALYRSAEDRKLELSLMQLHFNRNNQFFEADGVTNIGSDREPGNIGVIHLKPPKLAYVNAESGAWDEGIYFVYLALSKVSTEFELDVPVELFDAREFVELSTPINLPNCVQHPIYGYPDFNLVTSYTYGGIEVDGYVGTLIDRGYDVYWNFFQISYKKTMSLYQYAGGKESWGRVTK